MVACIHWSQRIGFGEDPETRTRVSPPYVQIRGAQNCHAERRRLQSRRTAPERRVGVAKCYASTHGPRLER